MRFYIDDSFSLKEQYSTMYSALGERRVIAQNTPEIVDIYPHYGQGTIQLYSLQDGLLLTLYNHTFKERLTTHFSLSQHYFKLEYCVDGHLHIIESGEESILSRHQMSISMPQKTTGEIIKEPNTLYQGVSIAGNTASLKRYFGSLGVTSWQRYMRALSQQKQREHYLGENTSPAIQDIFHAIFYSRMALSTKPLYYESKVMELFSVLLAEGKAQSALLEQLSHDELNSAVAVNDLLWQSRFDVPTLKELAKQLDIAPYALQQAYKLVYGKPIFSYFRELQLHRGALLLKETQQSVTEIALEVGYASQSNFGYAFKRRYGLSPSAYRQRYAH